MGDDFAAALVAVLLFDLGQFLRNDLGHARRLGQDVEQVDDLVHRLLVFADDLVLLQGGQALQPQFQDPLRLRVGQPVALLLQTEFGRQPFGTGRR